MKLRMLTDNGIAAFTKYLHELKEDAKLPIPESLLKEEAGMSEPLTTTAKVEQRVFPSRFAAAEYLYKILSKSNIPDIDKNRGLWTWLTLYYFDQLCPADKQGNRMPGEDARYIPLLSNARRYYRHLQYGSYALYRMYSDTPHVLPVLLMSPLSVGTSEMYRMFIQNTEILAARSAISVANRLYYDPTKNKMRRGAGSKINGSVRRLIDYLQQIRLTFDIHSIEDNHLFDMLPREFDSFVKAHKNAT